MTHFLDSSAVVKRYADEAGSDHVRHLGGPLVISAVARVEVPSALWRKHRVGELGAEDAALLVRAFELDVDGATGEPPRLTTVDVSGAVINRAAVLVRSLGLRTLDALQLASAVEARDALGAIDTFVVFDAALRDAAAAERFEVTPH